MIVNDKYMQEFSLDEDPRLGSVVVATHDKCGEKSGEDLNLFGVLEWAEKHRYTCPEIEVESITIGGMEDGYYVVISMTKDGRVRAELRKGIAVVQEVTRKLIPSKDPAEKD